MAIHLGPLNFDPSQMWFGNNPLKEVWVGSNMIWPTGPKSDAKYWFDFDDPTLRLRNRGTTNQGVAVSGPYLVFDHDHAIFGGTTTLSTTPTTSWANGFSVSMWTKDATYDSGWKTLVHRAVQSGTLTNEAYIVQNTSSTTTKVFAGLKFGSVHREYESNYSVSVSSDWFHTVVTWRRLTTTSYNCTIYINGVSRGSFTASGYASNTKFSTEKLYIGGNRSFGEWTGRLDDFLVWDRGLSAAEVTELYNQGRSWLPRINNQGPFYFVLNEPGSQALYSNFGATSWEATGLPVGITLSSNGVLSGAATQTGSGTMVITATGGGLTVTKSLAWTVEDIPSLTTHAIRANGANKTSHSGWARPSVTWQLTYADTGAFESNGTLISAHGRGRINAQLTLTNGRNSRVVSNTKGVLATGSGTNQNYTTPTMVLQQGERLHLEIENYSGNANDRLFLFIREPV